MEISGEGSPSMASLSFLSQVSRFTVFAGG